MARPKTNNERKGMLTLTISSEVREMAEYIRANESISISEFLEKAVRKEYQKLKKEEQRNEEHANSQ